MSLTINGAGPHHRRVGMGMEGSLHRAITTIDSYLCRLPIGWSMAQGLPLTVKVEIEPSQQNSIFVRFLISNNLEYHQISFYQMIQNNK